MQRTRSRVGTGFALLTAAAAATATPLAAQQPWLNSPLASTGQPVFPFFEGWYENEDGSVTLSFGYLNRNPNEPVEILHGDRNRIEPPEFDGRQPTWFLPSRNRGTFAVTLPASRRNEDVWWYLTHTDGNVYKVPGRARSTGYQLDWYPRPHGSLPPLVWFTTERDAFRGPEGGWAPAPVSARVGQPVTLSVSTRDPSERDPEDRRFREPLPLNVTWSKYQGPPGAVTFSRHPSTPEAPPGPAGGRGFVPRGPEGIRLAGGRGTAQVLATFPAPGEWVMRVQVDNFGAPDSTPGDQCCWTNGYVRVRVVP